MNDMSAVIVAKSDQLNADDLLSGPRTLRITDVTIRPGTEQPVSIHYEGDQGKPWKTCKSMNRVLVQGWGADANKYKGRSVKVFRDPAVKWGGMEVGGIRISEMSDIQAPFTMALTATKGSKKAYTVKVLKADPPKAGAPIPAALKLLDPAFKEVQAKNIATWVGWCETAISKIEDPANMAKWRADMAPHFLAAEHQDVSAVKHVMGLADDRLDALAQQDTPA